MHDEFRVEVRVAEERAFISALRELERDELGASANAGRGGAEPSAGPVAVTHEQGTIFLYADSSDTARHAREAVGRALSSAGIDGKVTLWRWHPEEERWEDANVPLPADSAGLAAERARLDAEESAESARAGYAEWEVRITVPTLQEARALTQRLHEEGLAVVRRWRHLMVGADNEDEATALAERLRAEAPAGSELETMGAGGPAVWNAGAGRSRYFAVFGGLGW